MDYKAANSAGTVDRLTSGSNTVVYSGNALSINEGNQKNFELVPVVSQTCNQIAHYGNELRIKGSSTSAVQALTLDVGTGTARTLGVFGQRGSGGYATNVMLGVRNVNGTTTTDDFFMDYHHGDPTPAVWFQKPIYMTNGLPIASVADNQLLTKDDLRNYLAD